MLILNFLNTYKQKEIAKRPGIERGNVEKHQTRYFKSFLTLKNSKVIIKSVFAFVSTGRCCGFVPGKNGSGLFKADLLKH